MLDNQSISKKILRVFGDIFDDESFKNIENNYDFSQNQIPDWDSIGHVRLMMAIEKEFNINIPIEDAFELLTFIGIKNYVSKSI